MPSISTRALVLAAIAALAAPQAGADVIADDLESHALGQLPGIPWRDISERTVDRPVPTPTVTVIETVDAQGIPTRAIQTGADSGTNGAFVPVVHTRHHSISMDVRIDRVPGTNQGWPIAVGFIQDLGIGSGDVNGNPQALIYGWSGRRWRFFLSQGQDLPAVDFAIPGPQYEVGVWYRFTVTADTETGAFEATVADALSGAVRNTASFTHTNWNPARGMYDAFTLFDGELAGATTVGQASVDNILYESDHTEGCNPADMAVPFGVIDLADIQAFVVGFQSLDGAADLAAPFGVLDLADIQAFVTAFNDGCP